MYFVGIGMVILSGIILKKFPFFAGVPAPFVMELPKYHMPSFRSIALHVWDRSKAFIIKAGTIDLYRMHDNLVPGKPELADGFCRTCGIVLASVGGFIAPLFLPLGFGNWQSTVAVLSGILAKENVVATFGILYGVADATEKYRGCGLSDFPAVPPIRGLRVHGL